MEKGGPYRKVEGMTVEKEGKKEGSHTGRKEGRTVEKGGRRTEGR